MDGNGAKNLHVETIKKEEGQVSAHSTNATLQQPQEDNLKFPHSQSTEQPMPHVKIVQPQPSESSPLNPSPSGNQKMNQVIKTLLLILKTTVLLFFPSLTFLKFFANATIPPLAENLIPLFFIGNIPNESALALAGQFTFIGVIIEVIQEGICNSLFYYVGRNYTVNRRKSLEAFKICLIILAALGSLLTVFMVILNRQFVKVIGTPEALAEATKKFLYTSSFSFPVLLVNAGLSNFLLITTSSYLIAAQLSNVILSFVCNFFLFGQQDISLHWNIEQLGYYKIIQTCLNCASNFFFVLLIERIGPLEFIFKIPIIRQLRSNFKELLKVSWGNFGDSAVRNFFYFVVTLKFINNLGETEIAAWNLLNSIVWGLLLIPSFTVANYAKVKIGHHGTKSVIRGVATDCLKCLCVWLIVVSIFSLLYWPELAAFFGKSNEKGQNLSTKLFHEMGWIFIIFSLNNTMDSLFFGVGKTEYVFYQSVVTNLVVYFIPWILYLFNVITPTYWIVVGLYLAGMLVDFCLTTYFCSTVWKHIPDY